MTAPRGTLCVLNQIHEHLFVEREDNRIPLHKLLGDCSISGTELDTIMDYLGSRGAIVSYKKHQSMGQFELEVVAHPGLPSVRDLIIKENNTTHFDYESNTLTAGEREVHFGGVGKNLAADLLRTVFKDPKRTWANDEIYDDWHYNERETGKAISTNRIYHAARKVNEKAATIGIEEFLFSSTKDVRINPKYLS